MLDDTSIMNETKRLRFLAQNYNWLRGWSTALGLLFTIWGIARLLGGFNVTVLIYGWLLLPSLALLALFVWTLQGYYERRFGTVKEAKRPGRPLTIALAFFIFMAIGMIGGPDYRNFHLALDPTVLSSGIIITLSGLLPTFPWRYHAPFGLLLIGIGFLPAMHVLSIDVFRHGWNDLIVGIAWLACGMIDHLILMRKFSPLQLEDSHV